MEPFLKEQLLRTGYVHFPLEADPEGMLEPRLLQKEATQTAQVWDGKQAAPWRFDGERQHAIEQGALRLETNATADEWPEGEPSHGRYATFGSYTAHLDISAGDWQAYNCLVFQVKPECDGLHSPCIRVGFVNDGEKKIPDAYSREGFHCINLQNNVWNTCVWEYDSIPHDRMTELLFRVHKYGRELTASDTLRYTIRGIELRRVETPETKLGWQCGQGRIAYSQSGYWTHGRKTAVANVQVASFVLEDATSGETVYAGAPQQVNTCHGTFTMLDFSAYGKPGRYRLRMGDAHTEPFAISDTVMENAVWKMINFLFCERCGFPVPGKHGACHGDIVAEHDGLSMIYNGGWHDAADVSQQTLQTAEVVHALLETAQAAQGNVLLNRRLMEEALWGLDFVLRMKFPDGYRATSAGIRRWNNNLIGDMDDAQARVYNNAFDHLIIAGVEAYAARVLAPEDEALAYKCAEEAKIDCRMGIERFEAEGIQLPHIAEHSYGASRSQYYAAACWSAALTYELTGDETFAADAARYADKLLACQDTGEAGVGFDGFFYRDEAKGTIVHFNHQSREQLFAQALYAVCTALPEHPHKPAWEAGLRRQGGYIKALMRYSASYGMIPAGIYHIDEIEDRETFDVMNMFCQFEKEYQNHREQITGGVSLGGGYYIKQFPVCFSYRGNTASIMALGKAAALAGRYFGDAELLDIARDQVYWTVGKNPFGESMIYGEGHTYAQQYTALLGETVGEIAVGVQTQGNEDLPYWPPANIATYREVWTSSASRWLWAVAELYGSDMPTET